VEDNAVNQRVMVILLTKWGHTSVLANNGEEAVEKVTKEEFDLILMDVRSS
jgi:CheY-like chemotaxis protein